MSSMSGPICLWADWATSVGNEEEKSEVCMCVMCVTAARLVHRASVAHSVTPANKPATVISTFMVRFFVLTGLCLRFSLVYVFHKHKCKRKCKQKITWQLRMLPAVWYCFGKKRNMQSVETQKVLTLKRQEGWKCSMEFEVIHISLFDSEVRPSPPLFIQTVKQRAATGEYLIPGPQTLHLPDFFPPLFTDIWG